MGTKTERIEARFSPELKALAKRAALASGQALTDYLATLVKTDAPNHLKAASEISLTNQQFDAFITACDNAAAPSKKLLDAAQKLDSQGF
tara:strand:+ start:815 stop:1084 length:270 start_codon:yes stop_codon:yes gene_type:complete